MVRPYGIKVPNWKRKGRDYVYSEERARPLKGKSVSDSSDAELVTSDQAREEQEVSDSAEQLAGIPIVPHKDNTKRGAIFILEKASLEVAKVGKTYQILNSDDHANFIRKNNRNPSDYRPDITHQALLTILDSPLNKAGMVRTVYVRTDKGVLFEIKPYVRLPRTYKRFSGIMLQLLQRLNITSSGKREKLLRVIKNPVTQYLPVDSRRVGFSYTSDKSLEMNEYLGSIKDDANMVFVVGAMAHGKIDQEYTDDFVSISGYPLSAAWCICTICGALQSKWKIF